MILVSVQVLHKPTCTATEAGFGFRKKRDCTILIAKTKVLLRCAVTAQLICAFGLAYAYCLFSDALTQITVLWIVFFPIKCLELHVIRKNRSSIKIIPFFCI